MEYVDVHPYIEKFSATSWPWIIFDCHWKLCFVVLKSSDIVVASTRMCHPYGYELAFVVILNFSLSSN